MNKRSVLAVLLIAAASFLAGYWVSHGDGRKGTSAGGRRILYYVDPMHPAYKSDKPGIAPDCGMQLEPVYADGSPPAGGAGAPGSLPPGSVQISPEKQQLIGVKVATVEKGPVSHALRVLGRVAPDETRLYRINAAIDGWVKKTYPVTTGSVVRKDQVLAAFYSPEFLSATQAYIFALSSLERFQASGKETKEQLKLTNANIENYKNTLRNLGMSEHQMEEIRHSQNIVEQVDIRSPASGIIISRNISLGQRFDKGTELFRIADLSRVWILADTFESEAQNFRPGQHLKVRYQGKLFPARVSDVPPQFDPVSRTLKVRLEAENPGYVLRPDMFVDVELPVTAPPAVTVPVDAVLDSGLKKTVFVDRGNGMFEPRQVETGRSLGERVVISRGLTPGEKVVVSGNFLIDSETRLKQTAMGITGKAGRDPVCGMDIDEDRSRAAGNLREYKGKTYLFCSPECRETFGKEPQRYAASPAPAGTQMPVSHDADHSSHGAMQTPKTPAKGPSAGKGGATGRHDHDQKMHAPSHEGASGGTMPESHDAMPGAKGGEMAPPMTGTHDLDNQQKKSPDGEKAHD